MAVMLMLLGIGTTALLYADDYDPANPAEPGQLFMVRVTANYPEGAYLTGSGSYELGTTVRITTSAKSPAYTFCYWLKDSVRYCDDPAFDYVVTSSHARFEAHYSFEGDDDDDDDGGYGGDYDPENPGDPNMDTEGVVRRYPLTLVPAPAGSCSFNVTSGKFYAPDESIDLKANPARNFSFNGWYMNGRCISTEKRFFFSMPSRKVVLTASLSYNPQNPDEPSNGQEDVDVGQSGILGDVNRDGVVNLDDALLLIELYAKGDPEQQLQLNIADMDYNNVVNTADAVLIVNAYLQSLNP